MKARTRREVVRDLGLMTLGSLVSRELFAAEAAKVTTELISSVSHDSICVFLDGSWLLRATDSNFIALTVDDSDHCYTQTIWSEAKPVWSKLECGIYDAEVFRKDPVCTCATKLLASQSGYLPYLRDVRCIFEPTSSGAVSTIDPTLRIINMPTPDKLHTAARIKFHAKDYQGTDCASGHNFKAPSSLATVVILEYKNATSLVVAQKATSGTGSTVVQRVAPGQHYHLRTSLKDPCMHGPAESCHIKKFTTNLAAQLRHKADGSAVSFWVDPDEVRREEKLTIVRGVRNITEAELGMVVDHPCPTHFKELANCAGGVLGGGG